MVTGIISVCIAAVSMIFVIVAYCTGRGKDNKTRLERDVEINIKLDQLCTSTNQILVQIATQDKRIQAIETRLAVHDQMIEMIKKGEIKND